MGLESLSEVASSALEPFELSEDFSVIKKKSGFNPTNKNSKIQFLVKLAGQISENNIQEFLIGSQFPKFKNQIQIPEIFLTFFVGRIKP